MHVRGHNLPPKAQHTWIFYFPLQKEGQPTFTKGKTTKFSVAVQKEGQPTFTKGKTTKFSVAAQKEGQPTFTKGKTTKFSSKTKQKIISLYYKNIYVVRL